MPYNLRKRKRVSYDETDDTYSPRIIKKRKMLRERTECISQEDFSWAQFNKYQPATDINSMNEEMNKEWVSPSSIKNALQNDHCLDWIKYHYLNQFYKNNNLPENLKQLEIKHKKQQMQKEQSNISILYKMGNSFEDKIIDTLKEEFPSYVTVIAKESKDVSLESYNRTREAILEGIPIISQAVLYNDQNRTRGIADLLVRSDYINRIFNSQILQDDEIKLKAPELQGRYHYRVIDIKWSTLRLCANSINILNSGLMPSYKGQLAIYNAALGLIQGYTPSQAYVMGKGWTFQKSTVTYTGSCSFDLLGIIDYEGWDYKYLKLTADAIKWVREVRYHGHNWTCTPPTRIELYPNMCNPYDFPYHGIKQKISNEIAELTDIWMVGPKNRIRAHNEGVFKWTDPNCSAEVLGITGQKTRPLVDGIININRDPTAPNIIPKNIKNNYNEWQNHHPLEFFIDFEAINECFYDQKIDLYDCSKPTDVIFMLGIGYIEQGEWEYKTFAMDKYTPLEERRIINQFFNFIDDRVNQYNEIHPNSSKKANLYYWGHAETTFLKSANKRHGYLWKEFLEKYIWTNFLKVIKDEPILIKGCKKFGLKEIGKKMFDLNLIQTKWESQGPSDGLTAMRQAAEYYRFINLITSTPKIADPIYDEYNRQKTRFNMIIFYNEIDCRMVYDIINYLRINHTNS